MNRAAAPKFGVLVKQLMAVDGRRWQGLSLGEVIELIRAELVALEEQRGRVAGPDDDMVLRVLVRVAALAHYHAMDAGLVDDREMFT